MRKIVYLKTITIILCIFLFGTSISSSNIINEDKTITEDDRISSDRIVMEYLFDEPLLNKKSIGNTVYDTIGFQGLLSGGNPGEPKLPSKSVNILLPSETKVSDITINPGKKVFLGSGFHIEPNAEPVPLSMMDSAPLPIPNETLYNSDDPYPNKLFINVGTQCFRGYSILFLELFPIEYIPQTGDLFYYEDLSVSVGLVESVGFHPLFRGLEEDQQEVISKVENPDVLDTYSTDDENMNLLNIDDYDLLIITTEELRDGFLSLKLAHDSDGVKTEIKTLTDIGSGNPDDIRDFIRNEYLSFNISYVLFGGDYDVVPAQDLWVEAWSNGYTTFMPSDLFYSCLDGTYNYDGDSRYGEPNDGEEGNDVDLVAEVFVGRAPVSNDAEVENFVDKTFSYMYSADWYLNDVLMVGEWLGFGGASSYGGNHMDQLIDRVWAHNYYTDGIPSDQYDINKLYDRDWPGFDTNDPWNTGWPKSELIDLINDDFHIINHLGHGNNYHVMKLDEPVSMRGGIIYDECHDIVNKLTNSKYSFIYSQACLSGAFDNKYSDGYEVPYDCIAEFFTVKTGYGAFAVIMNARYGWGRYGSTDGASQRFHRMFWDAIFGENILEFSRANQYSKEQNLYRISGSCMRWCYYQLNLFGDPTLTVKNSWYAENNIGVKSLALPTHSKPNDIISVNTTLVNNGLNDESNVLVSLRVNDFEIDSMTIPFFESMTEQNICFTWIPNAGVYKVTINVSIPEVTEEYYCDNEISKMVTVGVKNIDSEKLFNTIQEAIDDYDTFDGHRIFVPSGIYYENIVINKRISLIGEKRDTTIIQSNGGSDNTIEISNVDTVYIANFTIRNGIYGIYITSSSNNIIIENILKDNSWGLYISGSTDNKVCRNNIINNNEGLEIDTSSYNNLIYHNSFDNNHNAFDAGNNQWDKSYFDDSRISGGNWWSDYYGNDEFSGPGQNDPESDGIGDIPYDNIGDTSLDNYPLMNPWTGSLPRIIYIEDDNTEGPWDGTWSNPYQNIQDGLDVSSDSDTVIVYSGFYQENIQIENNIDFIGEEKTSTIIDGSGNDNVVYITGEQVNITGFTIQHSDTYNYNSAGIHIFSSDAHVIADNNIINNKNGIHFYRSKFNIISNNTIINNLGAISQYYSPYNQIFNNIIHSNSISGIELRYSSLNEIYRNNMSNNGQISLAICSSYKNNIFDNIITENDQGIVVSESTSNNITRNLIKYNYLGVRIDDSSDNNLYYNNLISNTQNAQDGGNNFWDNELLKGGNYWDDYNGVDSNNDGIGDTPYNIPGGNNQDNYPLMQPIQQNNLFIRGDANADGNVDMSDIIFIQEYLYIPDSTKPDCLDALDVNDDGQILMSDALHLLKALYIPESDPIPMPYPECGFDTTEDYLSCLCHPCFDCY